MKIQYEHYSRSSTHASPASRHVNGAAQNIRIKHKALEPHTYTRAQTPSGAVVVAGRGIVTVGLVMSSHLLYGIARKLYTHVMLCARSLVRVCVLENVSAGRSCAIVEHDRVSGVFGSTQRHIFTHVQMCGAFLVHKARLSVIS